VAAGRDRPVDAKDEPLDEVLAALQVLRRDVEPVDQDGVLVVPVIVPVGVALRV